MPDPARMDLERYWDGQRWTPRGRGQSRGENRAVSGWVVGLLIALAVTVPTTGYMGALPTWIPWPAAWVQSVPEGPEVAYPVFGSDDLVLFLARSMVAQESSINVTFVTALPTGGASRVQDAMSEALTQNPHAFVDGYVIEMTNGVTSVTPHYLYDDDEAERRRAETSSAVATLVVVSGAAMAEGDAQKAALIHDEIVRTATYDEEANLKIVAGSELADIAASQEAYGILVDHTAVCTGYAQAFLLAADAVGLRAVIVTGEANSGLTTGAHAWDRVWVSGAWRVVDVTWDDAGDDVRAQATHGVRRDYFLLNADDPKLNTREADLGWVLDARAGDYE